MSVLNQFGTQNISTMPLRNNVFIYHVHFDIITLTENDKNIT